MTTMNSAKKNFLYNSIYQIMLIILPVITTPYISRVLGAQAIGQFSYAYSIAVIFVLFIMLGLNNYGNRTIAAQKENEIDLKRSFWSIYSMQLSSSALVIILYGIYAFLIDNSTLSKIMTLHVVAAAFDINWLFFGLEKFKITTIRSIFIRTIMTLSVFFFVKSKEDLPLYAFIICLSSILTQLSLWPYVLTKIKFTKVNRKTITSHIKPNLILFIPVIAVGIYHYMDKVMLGLMSTETEVGFYESSDKIINIPMALITSLGTVMLPRVTNLIAKKETQAANKYMEKSIIFAMFLSSSICFGIMAISNILVPLYFGEGFEKCSSLFYILLPSCVFLAFANVIRTQYLIPMKQDKIYVTSIVLGAITNVIFNAILIPILASVGAAIGTLLTQIVVCVYQAYKVKDKLPIKTFIRSSLPFIASGIIMLIVITAIGSSDLVANSFIAILIDIIIGVVVYTVALTIMSKILNLRLIKIKPFRR